MRTAWLGRIWLALDGTAAFERSRWLLPLLFGLLSLLYGQDHNWDLLNYHYYGPYALLHGKIGYDLAPGQWQSYFNPTLDLLYFGLQACLPAPVVGFIMGALHGINFILLLGVLRQLLPQQRRLALLLAVGGVLGPVFLSEVGNTMGDNMTALLVLASLSLLLRLSPQLHLGGHALYLRMFVAGGLAGLASGLKLTNGLYALALCVALGALPLSWPRRIGWAWLYGCGVLAGVALSAGHWYWRMWQTFGNPFFPQFNNYFGAVLAGPVAIGDTGWLPRSWQEKLLWPVVFALDPKRVSEIPLSLWVWPLLYLLALVLMLRMLWRGFKGNTVVTADPQRRLLMAFALAAYLIWLHLFCIYRYLVVLELLAPLLLWLLLEALWPRHSRWRLPLVLVVVAAGLPHQAGWGHARWSRDALTASPPSFAMPRNSMLFTVHGELPTGWLVPFFAPELAVVSLESGFPESQGYRDRVQAMLDQRQGPHAVLLHERYMEPALLERAQQVLGRSRLAMDALHCTRFPTAIGRTRQYHFLCPVQRQP